MELVIMTAVGIFLVASCIDDHSNHLQTSIGKVHVLQHTVKCKNIKTVTDRNKLQTVNIIKELVSRLNAASIVNDAFLNIVMFLQYF